MMGIQQTQDELFNYQVNLEKRVRARIIRCGGIHGILDSVVCASGGPREFYGSNGHVGTDPVVLVKMLLLLFWTMWPVNAS